MCQIEEGSDDDESFDENENDANGDNNTQADIDADRQQEECMSTASNIEDIHDKISDDDYSGEVDIDDLEKYRRQRENMKWPDEVDTPHEAPARERFVKYRAMKSFKYVFEY